jgi:hypothetical protein
MLAASDMDNPTYNLENDTLFSISSICKKAN